MILYNLRHRGPFEYDKLTLNILQLAAESKELKETLSENELKKFEAEEARLAKIYDSLVSATSIGEKILSKKIKVKNYD